MKKTLHATALAGTLLLPAAAVADPRWWWDDRRITSGPGAETSPAISGAHVFFVPDTIDHAIAVVYEKVDPASGRPRATTTCCGRRSARRPPSTSSTTASAPARASRGPPAAAST